MEAAVLHRNHLASILGSLTLDDMAWAMKFLAEKIAISLQIKPTKIDVPIDKAEKNKTEKFLSEVYGSWNDEKDADEMVHEIYESRKNKDTKTLEKIFDE